MTVHSEEDVQNKLVIPYLKDELGLDVTGMDFQRTLKVRVGHKEYDLDSKKQPFTAQGRYDALIKKGDTNLFILEVKGPDIKISLDDIEQAISYARLVHPIAPIVIVTNGRDWKIYDTITKEEMAKDDSRIRGPYQAHLPDEKYFEAMKVFFGLSQENVLAFCREQVYQYTMELVGSPEDRDKKYIKELFEPWTELDNFFSAFLNSFKKSFALVGNSGTGKTCWVCHTAKKILEKGHVVFFYRAISVKGDILSMMSRDLGWALSGDDVGLKVAKRLFEIFKDEPVFLFVDGLDEIDPKDARLITDDVLRMLAHQNVRLVLSCKSAEWARLVSSYEPTRLSAELFKVNDKNAYMLVSLEEGQLQKMVERYRRFYQFAGTIDDQVMHDFRKKLF